MAEASVREMARAHPEPARGKPHPSARRPAVQVPGLVGGDRGLGGLVVDGCAGFRKLGCPNGPPSPRLAPGGFYGVTRVRDGV